MVRSWPRCCARATRGTVASCGRPWSRSAARRRCDERDAARVVREGLLRGARCRLRRRRRRRSPRRTGGWPDSSTPTPIRVTPAPRRSSRRSPPPTTWWATRRSARSTTRSARWARWVSASAAVAAAGSVAPATPRSTAPISATSSATCSAAVSSRRGRRRGPFSRGPQRGTDLEADLHLAFVDAVRGVTTSVNLISDAACTECNGSCAAKGTSPRVCADCGGRGVVDDNQGFFSLSHPCATCGGRGSFIDTPCPGCAGTGVMTRPRVVKVRLPEGVNDGQQIRLKGKGGPGRNGGPDGDLYVRVHVDPHPLFGREGDDLIAHRARSRSPRPPSAPTSGCRPSTATPSPSASRPARPADGSSGSRAGASPRPPAPATCWSPSRSPCPASCRPTNAPALEALPRRLDAVAPRPPRSLTPHDLARR